MPEFMRSSNQKQRRLTLWLAVLVVATVIISIAAIIVNRSALGPTLDRLGAVQQEIIRINDLAGKFEPDLSLDQLRANVEALTNGDIALLNPERMRAGGKATIPKDVLSDETVDGAEEKLESAAASNSLGSAYRELLRAQLEKEQELIGAARSQAKRDELRQVLDTIDSHVASLLEQVNKL